MKIAIVNLPHAPLGDNPLQGSMIDDAAKSAIGFKVAADAEVIVALFPDGSHRVVKDRDGNSEITVVNR